MGRDCRARRRHVGGLGRRATPYGYLYATASESAADGELLTGTGAPSEAINAWPLAGFLSVRTHGKSPVASVAMTGTKQALQADR